MTLEEERDYWKELVKELADRMDQEIIKEYKLKIENNSCNSEQLELLF
jgi:hypothetical protein